MFGSMNTVAYMMRLRLVSTCLRSIAVPLALAFLLLLHWTPAYATPSFEVSGRCVTTSWHPTGKQVQPLEFLFDVRVAGPVWSIRMTDLAAKAGKRASSDYSELVCDGEDIFVVHHVQDALRTKVAKRLQYDTFGMARQGKFPDGATPLEKILWLTFCSGEYPPLSAEDLPPIDNSLLPTNVAAVRVEYHQTTPHVPKSLEVWAKGVLVWGTWPQQPALMRAGSPFEESYLALEFASASPTNTAEGTVIPQHVEASYYGLDLSAKPPRRFRATQTVVSVERFGPLREPVAPPPLAGSANVLDTRYTSSSGRAFHYVETNGTWISRSDPDPTAALEAKTPSPTYKIKPPRLLWGVDVKLYVFAGLTMLAVWLAVAFCLFSFLRRKAAKVEASGRYANH
jgi:hypothetical protein